MSSATDITQQSLGIKKENYIMKTLTFNKNSFHYKLAEFGGLDKWNSYDICSYTRRVVVGMLLMCVLGSIFAFLANIIIQVVLGIGFSFWYRQDLFSDWGKAGMIMIVTSAAGGIILFVPQMLWRAYQNRQARIAGLDLPVKPDGFIKTAYKSHKQKYCLRIDFN